MTLTATLFVLTWAAIVTLGFALAGVLARVHRLEQGLAAAGPAVSGTPGAAGPSPGIAAPAVDGVDVGGGALLLFADRECASCRRVLPVVTDAGRAAGLPVHVLWSGPAPSMADDLGDTAHHPEAGAAYEAFGVRAAPWLVVVGPDGRIAASGPTGSAERAATVLAVVEEIEQIEEVDR